MSRHFPPLTLKVDDRRKAKPGPGRHVRLRHLEQGPRSPGFGSFGSAASSRSSRRQATTTEVYAARSGKTVEEAREGITAAWAARGDDLPRPAPTNDEHAPHSATRPATVGADWTGGPGLVRKQADALAALVAPHMGLKHEPSMGREFIGQDAAATKLRMAYHTAAARGERPGSDLEAHRSFMGTTTTSDYPQYEAIATEVVVGRALEQAPIGLREVVHVINAADWRARNHVGLTGANRMETVNEGGEVKFVTIDEDGQPLPAPVRKAGFFRATDELLRNAASTVTLEIALARAMVEGANETMRAVIAEKIVTPGNLADGVAVFDSSRGNVQDTAGAITVANLSGARTGLERQVDSQGVRRPVEPGIILVAPEQRTAAEEVVAEITAAEVDEVNPFTGRLRVVSDPGHRTRFANYIAQVMSVLAEHAIDIGWMKDNPAKGVRQMKTPTDRAQPHIASPDWAVDPWRSEAAPLPRLIFEIGVGSVHRPGDWPTFRSSDCDGESLQVQQRKTDKGLWLRKRPA